MGSIVRQGGQEFKPGVAVREGLSTTWQHSGLKNFDWQSGGTATISGTKQFDAFGNQVGSTGTWVGPFSHAGPFGYQSDGDIPFQQVGHRWLDPTTGRFLTRDPIKDGRNWYGYGAGLIAPTSSIDPTGLMSSVHNPQGASATAWVIKEGAMAPPKSSPLLAWLLRVFGHARGNPPSLPPGQFDLSPDNSEEELIPVYRVGRAGGEYWAEEDPRTNPNWYSDYGMRHEDNPGTIITEGFIRRDEENITWERRGARDYDGNLLGNRKDEIHILIHPWTTVSYQREFPWDPSFWRRTDTHLRWIR